MALSVIWLAVVLRQIARHRLCMAQSTRSTPGDIEDMAGLRVTNTD